MSNDHPLNPPSDGLAHLADFTAERRLTHAVVLHDLGEGCVVLDSGERVGQFKWREEQATDRVQQRERQT